MATKVLIELFSTPGCGKCAQAKESLRAVAEAFGADRVNWREVDVLKEIDYAVDVGITAPPAIALDGELVFPTLPTAAKLRKALESRLGQVKD